MLVDGPAQLRTYTGSHSNSPLNVAKMLYRQILSTNPQAVIIAFDHRERMPSARMAVWQQRAPNPKQRQASPDEIASATVTSLGSATWNDFWATTAGKLKMFRLLYQALKQLIVGGFSIDYQSNVEWIMTEPTGPEIWCYPFFPRPSVTNILEQQPYGEAEAQVVMAAQHYIYKAAVSGEPIPPTLIITNDTDIVIQMAGIWARKVMLAWAQVWQAPGGQVYRGIKSNQKFKQNPVFWQGSKFLGLRKWEIVSMDKVQACSGKSQMLWKQFCWLSVGGVDYCKGLGRFGWYAINKKNSQKTILSWLERPSPFEVTTDPPGFKFDLSAFCAILNKTRGPKKGEVAEKNGGAAAFVEELNKMLFCIEYYVWHNATRPHTAGPDRMNILPIPEPKPLSLWVMATMRKNVTVAVHNDYPSCTTLPSQAHADDQASLRKYLSH